MRAPWVLVAERRCGQGRRVSVPPGSRSIRDLWGRLIWPSTIASYWLSAPGMVQPHLPDLHGHHAQAGQFPGAGQYRGEVQQPQVVPVLLVAADALVVIDAIAAAVEGRAFSGLTVEAMTSRVTRSAGPASPDSRSAAHTAENTAGTGRCSTKGGPSMNSRSTARRPRAASPARPVPPERTCLRRPG